MPGQATAGNTRCKRIDNLADTHLSAKLFVC